jgi:hypothetical protein
MFRQATKAVLSHINYGLANTAHDTKSMDELRSSMVRGAFHSIGLTYRAKGTNRLAMHALTLSEVGLGFGIADIRTTEALLTTRNLQRLSLAPHPAHRAALYLPMHDILNTDGTLKSYPTHDLRKTKVTKRHLYLRLMLLREYGMLLHIGGGLPRTFTSAIPPQIPYKTPRTLASEAWMIEHDPTRPTCIAKLNMLPSTMVGFFPEKQLDPLPPTLSTGLLGSFDIFTALYMAISLKHPNTVIHIVDLRMPGITFKKLHTKDDRLAAGIIPETKQDISHALNQAVRLIHRAPRSRIIASITLTSILESMPEGRFKLSTVILKKSKLWPRHQIITQISNESLQILADAAVHTRNFLYTSNPAPF